MNTKRDFTPTPKSMNQSRIWSPEGKATKPENKNWSVKTKAEREGEVKQWVSKQDQYVRNSFLRRNHLYNYSNH